VTVPFAADWRVEKAASGEELTLAVGREPVPGKPRRPWQFAIAELGPFTRVTMELEVKRVGKSLILPFAWQSGEKFNYAHLSVDDPTKQPVHNGVFHVFSGERVRISYPEPGPGVLASQDWTPVRLEWNGATGEVKAFVNGKLSPALRAVDLSLRSGKVGLGSFNETGSFRKVRIRGR
jgi:hypothetical protein